MYYLSTSIPSYYYCTSTGHNAKRNACKWSVRNAVQTTNTRKITNKQRNIDLQLAWIPRWLKFALKIRFLALAGNFVEIAATTNLHKEERRTEKLICYKLISKRKTTKFTNSCIAILGSFFFQLTIFLFVFGFLFE